MTRVAIIVAVADNGVIGKDNALPWRLPEDMQHFKRTTMGKPVIMGRKTYESIGRPLPGRTNVVITRNKAFQAAGVEVVGCVEEALTLARTVAQREGAEEVMVMGGAEIYAAALPLADRLYITEVHADVAGDAKLCPIDWANWRETSRNYRQAETDNAYDYSFACYERVAQP